MSCQSYKISTKFKKQFTKIRLQNENILSFSTTTLIGDYTIGDAYSFKGVRKKSSFEYC